MPEPVLLGHNLVAVFSEPDRAREVGAAPDGPSALTRDSGADPEGVTMDAAVKSLRGALPGAVVGALPVAVIVAMLQGWGAGWWWAQPWARPCSARLPVAS